MTADPYPFPQVVDLPADPLGVAAPATAGLVRDSFHDEVDGQTRLVEPKHPLRGEGR